MPHLAIDYSAHLADAFDRAALVRELHPLVLAKSGSAGVCKTLMRPAETYVGDGPDAEGAAFVHVEVGLKPGRSEALKGHLAESILLLLGEHLRADGVVLSVEVRELSRSYRLTSAAPRVVQQGRTRPAASAPPTGFAQMSNPSAVSGHSPPGGLRRGAARSCG